MYNEENKNIIKEIEKILENTRGCLWHWWYKKKVKLFRNRMQKR